MITEPMAEAAANWWMGSVKAPVMDMGDARGEALMAALNRPQEHTEEQLRAFKEALKKRILEEQPHTIYCDYDPDRLLVESANEAGIEYRYCTTFPVKSGTFFSELGEVHAKMGYGKPNEQIYPS